GPQWLPNSACYLPYPTDAKKGRARWPGTHEKIDLTAFSTPPYVFDLTLAENVSPVEITPLTALQYPTVPDHQYLAVAPNGFLTPLAIFPTQLTPDLRTAQADYIAIGPPDLLASLQPLLDHRASQGLAPLAVPLYAIYDQFSGGVAHPEAIRHFLQYATQNWATPPKYVVLVGDSSYDPLGNQYSSEINRVPSYFLYTFYGGETVTDVPFAQLDDDNLPDLVVGRIPARTPEQVATLIEKTLAYEQAPTSERSHHVLAIADGQETSFTTDAQTFLSYFPTDYTSILLAPPKGDTTAAGQITEILNEGVLFMSYFGHGSILMLGKDRIFSVEDGAALTNRDHLPIMINITCLAGLFTHPEAESLTEAMLWNPSGGSVAALAATSLTIPADQAFLTKAFVDALAQNPNATLGELFLTAQRLLPVENEGVREVLDTFLLFGDPALKLP
ncbi:MAG TPA: C25 family cysteine peptidase, partial [Anaerolineales bacterium]|nr:C25 family cysteine peptidase [Anaerolineales bacterium]